MTHHHPMFSRRPRLLPALVLGGLLALAAASVRAEEEAQAYAFDAQDKPLAEVQAAAKAAERLIFLDFFLHG